MEVQQGQFVEVRGRPWLVEDDREPGLTTLRLSCVADDAQGEQINFKMMDQSRHRSVETLRGYVRDAEIFKEHEGAGLL